MKPYDKDIDIVFSPMSDETMSWLDELLTTCKRFGVDYYNASEKDRAFVEAVARKNYGIKQAKMNGVSVSTENKGSVTSSGRERFSEIIAKPRAGAICRTRGFFYF